MFRFLTNKVPLKQLPGHILNLCHRQLSAGKDDCKLINGLVLALYEKEPDANQPRLSVSGERFNESTQGVLQKLVQESGMDGSVGTGTVFNIDHSKFESICVVGCGPEGIGYNTLEAIHEGMENVRIASAIATRKLKAEHCSVIHLESMEFAEQVAEGATLAEWDFRENKCQADRTKMPKFELFDSTDVDAFQRGIVKATCQNMARKLSEMPANQLTPVGFAQSTVDYLCPCSITVEVRNQDWIESQNMNCLLAVARTSCEPPIFLELSYCGGQYDEKPVLLVGSGLTFNSGGLFTKEPKGLNEYRASMAGAAVVVATMRAIAELSLPINVSAVIPLCEHLISGMSIKPGDILRSMRDTSIAVHDTNNVAVLALADAFCFGIDNYKPKLVVDVATISDGIMTALGSSGAGIFTNCHYLWKQMHMAGAYTGDRVWRLPLWKEFEKRVRNYGSVDLSNAGRGKGSPALAAAFLREFCPCHDWLHMDIRGVGMNTTTNLVPYLRAHHMTGRPTRTLTQFLYQIACPDAEPYWNVMKY